MDGDNLNIQRFANITRNSCRSSSLDSSSASISTLQTHVDWKCQRQQENDRNGGQVLQKLPKSCSYTGHEVYEPEQVCKNKKKKNEKLTHFEKTRLKLG